MEPLTGSRMPDLSRRTLLGAAGSLGAAGVLYGVASGTSATASTPTQGTASLQVYPVPSIYPASTDYTMTVNGTAVPMQKFAGYDIAQLAMGPGTAQITLTKINNTNIGSWSISPQRLAISATVTGSILTFTLPSGGTGVFNVTAPPYNARPGTSGYSTHAFTSAIAAASSWGTSKGSQGTVYVPAGVYNAGNLVLLSNTALYLESGAVLRYTGDKAFLMLMNARFDDRTGMTFQLLDSPNVMPSQEKSFTHTGASRFTPRLLGTSDAMPLPSMMPRPWMRMLEEW